LSDNLVRVSLLEFVKLPETIELVHSLSHSESELLAETTEINLNHLELGSSQLHFNSLPTGAQAQSESLNWSFDNGMVEQVINTWANCCLAELP
jgi:hypothetical protein